MSARGKAQEAPRLDDDQLQEMLALTRGADSVELKLTVAEEERLAALQALGVDPLDAHIRQVFFFDTPELALDGVGVVARARRSQARPDDSVVKLRPVDPRSLDEELRASKQFVVEVDAMPGGFVCSASFKGRLSEPRVKAATAGELPLHKLFSKAQRAFYETNAPAGIAIDELSVLGPITVFKLKLAAAELGRRLAVELWNYPDGTRILELSTKCAPGDAFQVAAEARAYLSGRGIDLGGEQATKTRTALEFFAAAD